MPVKRTIPYNSGTFFITFTCYQWLPLIDKANGYDIVYSWFDYLKSKGHYINGYVFMPNHVHVMITFVNTVQSINTIVGNGKRFMAYAIIERFLPSNVSCKGRCVYGCSIIGCYFLSLSHARKTHHPLQQRYLLYHIHLLPMAVAY